MRIWIITGFLFLACFLSYSQSIIDLRIKRENALKEIEYTTRLLTEVDRNTKTSFNQLQLLSSKINQRNDLILTISDEIKIYEECISNNELVIDIFQQDIKSMKDEYAELIRSAYRYKNASDQLLFLLSADDFNQTYRRYQYLKKYAAYRQKQVQIIESLESVFKKKSEDLKLQNKIKQDLILQATRENEELAEEKERQSSEVSRLQSEKNNLQEKLSLQRKEEQELENEIQKILSEVPGIAEDENSLFYVLAPEQKLTGDNFEQNKQHLPWPVERGIITEHFGIHQHQVLQNVAIKNNGINITTEVGAKVRAVFSGEVSRIFGITGGNTAVIIRHGNYLTVYSNLKEVFVKKGDKVYEKQEIGTVYTDYEEQKSVLKFQIWHENQKLDPEEWIGR